MTVSWVVGSRGLLGSALRRTLHREGAELFSPGVRFDWASEAELGRQFATAIQAFAALASTAGRWEIYWAAGVGTMSSSEAVLEAETRILSQFLRLVECAPLLTAIPGALAFSSSAGAIYAGSPDYIITESTSPAPTTAYAHAKLRQEDILRSFARANDHLFALVARLSTLYGPGQSLGKRQGLLTHIARCILMNLPVQIYVPFDTIRDYIASDDAAVAMIAALRATTATSRVLTKIIASEQPVTIAEIIATFKKVARRAPRVVTSASKMSGIYSRRMCFRSTALPGNALLPRTSLLVGIAQVMAAERAAHMRGWHRGVD